LFILIIIQEGGFLLEIHKVPSFIAKENSKGHAHENTAIPQYRRQNIIE
jgi:hypothetical protein